MTKRITISLSDWVYEAYLQGITNKSKRIEEMLIKGVDYELGETQGLKVKQLELLKQIRNYQEEITKLKLTNGNLMQKVNYKINKENILRERSMHKTMAKKAQSDLMEAIQQ